MFTFLLFFLPVLLLLPLVFAPWLPLISWAQLFFNMRFPTQPHLVSRSHLTTRQHLPAEPQITTLSHLTAEPYIATRSHFTGVRVCPPSPFILPALIAHSHNVAMNELPSLKHLSPIRFKTNKTNINRFSPTSLVVMKEPPSTLLLPHSFFTKITRITNNEYLPSIPSLRAICAKQSRPDTTILLNDLSIADPRVG